MSLLDKIFSVGRVLQAGESLSDPATWKNRQNLVNALGVIVVALGIFIPDLQMSGEAVDSITGGIATLGMLIFNLYFNTATSDKIGIKKKEK